ncbi:MAG: hypothetical protein MJ249_15195 [Kiritimatiellae bacterium]|nr:hypothetical protein [Kiritimatiellia bacterium]
MKRATLIKSVLMMLIGFAAVALKAEISLPVGYAQLEWIKSTGNEYIKTGYLFQEYDIVQFDAEIPKNQPSTSWWCGVFGVRAPLAGTPAFILNVCTGTAGNGTYRYYRTSPQNTGNNRAFYDQRVTIVCNKTAMTWSGSDGSTGIVTAPGTSGSLAGQDSKYDMYVFGQNEYGTIANNSYAIMKLWSFKITAEDGTPRRDFVPCQNPSGQIGLWDKVEGKFYGNASGKGGFTGSDGEGDALLNYIQGTGTQYINTGYLFEAGTVYRATMNAAKSQLYNWAVAFGARCSTPDGVMHNLMLNLSSGTAGDGKLRYIRSATATGVSSPNFYDKIVDVVCDDISMKWTARDGASGEVFPNDFSGGVGTNDQAFAMMLFSGNEFGKEHSGYRSKMKLYSFSITAADGTVRRAYMPYLDANGRVGLMDYSNPEAPEFYENKGSGTFGYGFAYTTNETTMIVRGGTLAADDDFTGFDTVEKRSVRPLNAAAFMSYPGNLSVTKGLFSVQDAVARTYTVAGTLSLTTNAQLAVDWVGMACDSFTASALDLSQITAENPVVVSIAAAADACLDPDRPVVLITSGATAGDEAKFVSLGVSVLFEVANGQLLMRFADPSVPVRAVWTGHGRRGAMTDVQNWNCYNCFGDRLADVLPMDKTDVSIPANLAGSFEWLPGETLTYRNFEFPLAVSLTQDCDWQGMGNLGILPANTVVTLNGHTLHLKLSGDTSRAVTITDVATPGGTVQLMVAAGQTANNKSISLGGTVQLVKVGTGSLTVTRTLVSASAYTGGTVIEEGEIKAGGKIGDGCLFGSWGQPFTVKAGTVVDLNGYPDLNRYVLHVEGGTLKNSRADLQDNWGAFGNFAPLTTNVTINIAYTTTLHGSINPVFELNGHTLYIDIANNKQLNSNAYDYQNGTVVVRSGGWFRSYSNVKNSPNQSDSRTCDFDLNCVLNLDRDIWVRNLTMRTTKTDVKGQKALTIFGTYTPVSDYVNNFILADGSTLYLGGKEGSWDITAKTLSFTSGATVTIDLGPRAKASGDQLLIWTERPSGITFKLANNTENYRLVATEEGLFLDRGLLIIFR